MSKTYRFYSKAFGEHLQKLATGLIPKFVAEVNYYATSYGSYPYKTHFFIMYTKKGDYKSQLEVFIEVKEDISVDKFTEIFSIAYIKFFRHKFNDYDTDYPNYENYPRLRIVINDSVIAENNRIFIDDDFYYRYHTEAIQWHLNK